MNQAIKDFIESIVSIAAGALSGNIPLIGAAAIDLLGKLVEQAQGAIDGDGELSDEEKEKLKAVLASIQLKAVDDYIAEAGTTREQIDQFIANLKG